MKQKIIHWSSPFEAFSKQSFVCQLLNRKVSCVSTVIKLNVRNSTNLSPVPCLANAKYVWISKYCGFVRAWHQIKKKRFGHLHHLTHSDFIHFGDKKWQWKFISHNPRSVQDHGEKNVKIEREFFLRWIFLYSMAKSS